jgi:hypothetical protein
MEMNFIDWLLRRQSTEAETQARPVVFDLSMDNHFIETQPLSNLPGVSYMCNLVGGPFDGREVETLIGQAVLFMPFNPQRNPGKTLGVRVMLDGSAVAVYRAGTEGKWHWVGNLQYENLVQFESILIGGKNG